MKGPIVNHGLVHGEEGFTEEYIIPFRTNLGATRKQLAELRAAYEETRVVAACHGYALTNGQDEMDILEFGRVPTDGVLNGITLKTGRWND